MYQKTKAASKPCLAKQVGDVRGGGFLQNFWRQPSLSKGMRSSQISTFSAATLFPTTLIPKETASERASNRINSLHGGQ